MGPVAFRREREARNGAEAVPYFARGQPAMIPKKSAAFKLAPPTSAPSIFGRANSSAALSGLTLPPYWMRTASPAPCSYSTRSRMKACASWAICGVAVTPVPIAHTGS